MSPPLWKRIERRFPWSLLGVVLAAGFGLLAAYLALHQRRPDIIYHVMSEVDVLSVHHPVEDLKVLFRGEDVREANRSLRIYAMRVSNRGDLDLLQSHYDRDRPWGVKFPGGEIVEQPRVVDTSSEYLAESLTARLVGSDRVEFSKPILERGQSFTLEVLVMYPAGHVPVPTPFGKIAGIEHPLVIRESSLRRANWLIGRLTTGALGIHLGRFAVFALTFVALAWLARVTYPAAVTAIRERDAYRRAEGAFNSRVSLMLLDDGEEMQDLAADLLSRTNGDVSALRHYLQILDQLEECSLSPESLPGTLLQRYAFGAPTSESSPDGPPRRLLAVDANGHLKPDLAGRTVLRELISFLESKKLRRKAEVPN